MSDAPPTSSILLVAKAPEQFSVELKWYPNALKIQRGTEAKITIEGKISGWEASTISIITFDEHLLKLSDNYALCPVDESSCFKAEALVRAPEIEGEFDLAQMTVAVFLRDASGRPGSTHYSYMGVAVSAAAEKKMNQKLRSLSQRSENLGGLFESEENIMHKKVEVATTVIGGRLATLNSLMEELKETTGEMMQGVSETQEQFRKTGRAIRRNAKRMRSAMLQE